MSLLKSPSKSPVPVVGDRGVRRTALFFDLPTIHLPEIDLPAVLPPEKVTVEIIACRLRGEVVGRVAVDDRGAGVGFQGGDGADVGLLAGQGGGGGGVGPGLGRVEQ